MSLVFTGLAVCCIAGVLKGNAVCFAATLVFAALAIVSEISETQTRRI